jgi:hypothetical protein
MPNVNAHKKQLQEELGHYVYSSSNEDDFHDE